MHSDRQAKVIISFLQHVYKDSDNVIASKVPKDVVDGSVNEQRPPPANHDTGPSTSESVENSKDEQRHGPYDTVSKNKTALVRLEIHVHDDDQWILFISLALNLCFFSMIPVVAFDCCSKKKVEVLIFKAGGCE
jgi:hypothetical protein